MKILYVCGINLNQNFAGTVRVLNTAKHLAQNGNKVLLMAPAFGLPDNGIGAPGNLPFRISYVPTTNVCLLRTVLFVILFPLFFIYNMISFRPDVVYERELALIWLSPLTTILFGKKHFIEVNGFLPEDLTGCIKKHFIKANERISFTGMTGLVASSKGLIDSYRNFYGIQNRPSYVYENSVDTAVFYPIPKGDACGRTNLAPEFTYIISVGSFYGHHGLELIVESAGHVIAGHPEVRFIFAGDGPAKKNVEKLIHAKGLQEYFILPGSIRHAEIPYYINASEICIAIDMRYPRGNTPTKVPEYMACGKALLVSDNIEYEEIRHCGIAIPLDNSAKNSIADALNDLLDNKGLLEKSGRNSLDAAKNKYSYGIIVKKLNDFISGQRPA